MDLIFDQLVSRVKFIWILILCLLFVFFVLDPIVKRIDKWIENRKNRK